MTRVILGGGIGGLSAAYYLTKSFPKQSVTLIEASKRTGGWIKTDVGENKCIFEYGPHTIRPQGIPGFNTLKLVEEIGLGDEIVPIKSNHPASKNRFIFVNGRLHLLPNSLLGLFKKQEPFSKPIVSYILNDLKSKKKVVTDESIYDFVERRVGKEVADYLISPMICGICAGNAKEISVNFLMEKFFKYEQEYGSISNGIVKNFFKTKNATKNLIGLPLKAKTENWRIYSFKNGCETLPLRLHEYLLENNVEIKLNTKCRKISFSKNEASVNFNGQQIRTEHLISALPAKSLGHLLNEQHPELAKYLETLTENVSVAVINLYFDTNLIENEGFGLLVAPIENSPILGVIYDSCVFPLENKGTVLTVMMGGFKFEKYFGNSPSEAELLNTAMTHLKFILKIEKEPNTFKVNILENCIPQYVIGHKERLNHINTYIKTNELPISLCGSSYYGVGINDVILSAKNVIDKMT